MGNEMLIQEKVKDFVDSDKMFTSVDIGNAIKKENKTFVQNKAVAGWLRENFGKDQIFKNYSRTLIRVAAGREAYVYHPFFADANTYSETNQHALTPQEAGIGVVSPKSSFIARSGGAPVQTPTTVQTVISTSTTDDGSVTITDTDRVRIPAKFVMKLGWKHGDAVDTSKIDGATIPLCDLKVHKDGRIYVARSWLPFGTSPVKVNFDTSTSKITIVKTKA
jgi:hypothetical protein